MKGNPNKPCLQELSTRTRPQRDVWLHADLFDEDGVLWKVETLWSLSRSEMRSKSVDFPWSCPSSVPILVSIMFYHVLSGFDILYFYPPCPVPNQREISRIWPFAWAQRCSFWSCWCDSKAWMRVNSAKCSWVWSPLKQAAESRWNSTACLLKHLKRWQCSPLHGCSSFHWYRREGQSQVREPGVDDHPGSRGSSHTGHLECCIKSSCNMPLALWA